MFGRKKKQEPDPLGFSSIGSSPTVVPPASGAPIAPAPEQAPAPAGQPAQPAVPPVNPLMVTSGMNGLSVLRQMLGAGGPAADLLKQIQADPQGFRQRMLAQAQASGVSTLVMTPQGFQQLGATAGASAPPHVDVVDELTKAADMHDKGVLTDAEFEALKHKLLGH
jgi:hypothetical protein